MDRSGTYRAVGLPQLLEEVDSRGSQLWLPHRPLTDRLADYAVFHGPDYSGVGKISAESQVTLANTQETKRRAISW